MRKQQELLRYSIYQTANKKKELAYYWMLSTGENGAEICELHLGNIQKKICTFTLPDLRGIKNEGNEQEYIEGLVKVNYDCFKEAQDIKNLRVVLPQTYSYRFERGEFTNLKCAGKKVTFIMPQNDDLFEVTHGNKSWLLVADSKLAQLSGKDGYTISSCSDAQVKNRLTESYDYNINIEHVKKEELKAYEQQ